MKVYKTFLVVGATGTVGKALIKQLLDASESNLVRVFSRDEHKQHLMMQELRYSFGDPRLRFLLGDVRDKERLRKAMEGVDTVFSLAALKHVPSCEYNPFEAVKTNVIGTQNVIDCAVEQGVRKVIYTSTDKAADPTNVMGATKLLAERLISAAQESSGSHGTKFLSVRFGNVLGSRGSVLPLFFTQAKRREPLSITEPSMTRFVMTVNRAVELILRSAEISRGGESFVFKMPVVRLSDLARGVWRVVNGDLVYQERCIGLRPGEKMYEELMTEEEASRAVEAKDMYIILPYGRVIGDACPAYGDCKPASVRMYSSDDQAPISVEETEALVREALQTTNDAEGLA